VIFKVAGKPVDFALFDITFFEAAVSSADTSDIYIWPAAELMVATGFFLI
jgi:hypothetical protein